MAHAVYLADPYTATATAAATETTAENLATRHLSAGAHLSGPYRRSVLWYVHADPRRAIAPYMGADTARVLTHALRARKLDMLEAAALLAFALAVLAASPGLFWATSVLLTAWWAATTLPRAIAATAGLRSAEDAEPRRRARRAVTLRVAVLLTAVPVHLLVRWFFLRGDLGVLPALDDRIHGLTALAEPVVLLTLLPPLATVFGVACLRLARVAAIGRGAPAPDSTDRMVARARREQHATVNPYWGFEPFATSGLRVANWNFTLELRPPGAATGASRTVADPDWPGFDAADLVAHTRTALNHLAAEGPRFAGLPGLTVADRLIVSGHDRELPPPGTLDEHEIARIIRDPSSRTRHYLRCQVAGWDGEIVVSAYLHVALQGGKLYMECEYYFMPPVRQDFHLFAEPAQTSTLAVLAHGCRAVRRLPVLLARGPMVLAADLACLLRAVVLANVPRPRSRRPDVGAKTSVRVLAVDDKYHHYFQSVDPERYVALIDRQLFEATVEFLHGKVDLADLEERTTFVNNGVVNHGSGNVNVGVAGTQNSGNTVGAVSDKIRGSVTTPGRKRPTES